MIRLKSFLLALLLLAVGSGFVNAQALRLKIDSIKYDGFTSYIDSGSIYNNDTTFTVYCTLFNDSILNLNLPDSNLLLKATDSSTQLAIQNFTFSMPVESLSIGGKAPVVCKILNSNSAPLNISPGGSSVVIWPVYFSYTYGSANLTLNYINATGINDASILYNFIGWNHQLINLEFSTVEQRTVELYDATGRKVYQRQSSGLNDEIAWGDLPTGVFIIRIRQDQQSTALKLVHY